jgi:glycosyltransferase involved in cell wall biosynthesis
MTNRKMETGILLPNIFILTNSLYQGGAEKQSVILAKILKDKYLTTLIVYYGNNSDERLLNEIKQNNIKTLFLKGNHISKLWYLYKIFKQNKNSVIFSYLATGNMINAFIGSIARVKYKVGGVRNAYLSFSKFLLQRFLHNHFLTATIFNNYEGLITLTNKGFNKSKSFVIHNGIEIVEKEIRSKQNNKKIEILTVGRFVQQKDYYTALQVIYQLKQIFSKSSIKVEFIIVGYGEQEKLIRDWIENLN